MSVPQLPQEIIDDIISRVDCLRQSSLALVSTAFRPQVQRLRFHHVTLEDEHPRKTERLSNALVRNPTLGEYVQAVSLAHSWDSEMNADRGQAQDILGRVLRACRIHTLIFARGPVPLHILPLISPQILLHLRSLKLSRASRTPMGALHDALSLRPQLHHLELWTDHLYTEDAPRRDEREPIRFKRIHVIVDRAPPEGIWTLENSYNVEEEVAIFVMRHGLQAVQRQLTKHYRPGALRHAVCTLMSYMEHCVGLDAITV
jgi:hypothetical protein